MEVIIIGGIAAGMSTAAKAKRENPNANITVIEKENYVSFGACGLPYYLGDQFSDENEMFARTPQQMLDSGVNLLLNSEVINIDFNNKSLSIKNLDDNSLSTKTYDRLMIASGASAILPNIDGVKSSNAYTFTRLDQVNKLKANLSNYKNVVIVGGGFIGVEVADQLASYDLNVTLVHSNEHLMNSVFDADFSIKIKEALEDLNVNLILKERATSLVCEDDKIIKVITNNQEIEADAVIFATGFKPNTHFISDEIAKSSNGAIIIDEYGQTSIKDVFAAGDCATVPHQFLDNPYIPLATYANKLGRIIGTNIVSDKKDWLKFNGALGTSYLKAGHYEAAVTGLLEDEAKQLGLNVKTTLVNANNHSNYYPEQELIMIKLVYDAETFVLYGAQIAGKAEAVLRITALTTAIYAKLTTKDLGFMDFGYAPPFASTWEALNIAANTAK